jgi:hypothetical protein
MTPLSLVRSVLTAIVLVAFALSLADAAERRWQTGTWMDVGTTRTPWVADPATARLLGPRAPKAEMTLVSTFVLETDNERIELQDVVPFGQHGALDEQVTIGRPATFAIEKKTAYIRAADGKEYRLLVTKRGAKPKP